MINLLAGESLVPELLQQDSAPEKLAATLRVLLNDEVAALRQRTGFAAALASLAAPASTPSDAAASAIISLIETNSRSPG
jgi:lipid-A-disaccharide synthase